MTRIKALNMIQMMKLNLSKVEILKTSVENEIEY